MKKSRINQAELRAEWVACPPEHAAAYWAGWRRLLGLLRELVVEQAERETNEREGQVHEERIAE
jgi:hypothetical protein